MNKQIIRYFLWTTVIFLIFMVFNSWENEKQTSDKLKIKNEENSFQSKTILEAKTKVATLVTIIILIFGFILFWIYIWIKVEIGRAHV